MLAVVRGLASLFYLSVSHADCSLLEKKNTSDNHICLVFVVNAIPFLPPTPHPT